MRIIEFKAENVKKLRAVQIRPTGPVVQITGANGNGKSSVLDAIFYALGGTRELPTDPIRTGETKAFVRLDLGEIVVTRGFTAGGTTLTVEAANGARFPSPQKMLDDLLGTLTFDPLAFSRMNPKQQLETLRGMVKLDVDIDELDRLTKGIYEARTNTNREIKRLEAQRAAVPAVPFGTPTEYVSTSEIVALINAAGKRNTDIAAQRGAKREEANAIERARMNVNDKIRRANELLNEAAKESEALTERETRFKALPITEEPVDTNALNQQFTEAQATNKYVDAVKTSAKLDGELQMHRTAAETQTTHIDANETLKRNTIANADLPVAGLSFGDNQVLYNFLPLSQASGAEKLRVSVAIAMASNPKLRVLRINDGSLMDDVSFAILEEMAAADDFQIWVERVDTSGKVGIVMVDGAVSATNV